MATKFHLIGGNGGTPFSFNGLKNGATLRKIGVAVGTTQIKAVRAELTDGEVMTFGNAKKFKEFTFDLDERFTKLSLWGNRGETHLVGIRFTTSSERHFCAQMIAWPLKNEHTIDVGSGVCLGLEGNAGSELDRLGFVFLNTIKSSVLTNVKYTTLASYKPQVTKEYIKSVSYTNNTTKPQVQKCTYSRSVTKSTAWTTKTKIEGKLDLTVKGGFPTMMDVSRGFSLTLGREKTSAMTHKETITESDEVSVTVPAGKTVNVELSAGRADIELPYSSTVIITCLNGCTLYFSSGGHYRGVVNTTVNVNTTESTAWKVNITGKKATAHSVA
ncbi:aerolysin-like protein [Entelurus aequoreus]|uniref:aerolysin-like protein n=1 Tax=Entelurus aequoreus TaxID=161455 RepID=UPI002B1D3DC5|nr:aerolysin-like protein [Entelurus aequoreus]XP_061884652.1 aerolysin-like protein [Entelurus aequoreus]